ncbi:MAG: protein kinase [Kineosporiaceae bacterium]
MAEPTADLVAGRFRMGRPIGAGAQGRVVAAHDELLDRPVALKILQSAVPDAHARARFLREARAAAALVHPNIVTVFDIGAVDGPLTEEGTTPYIAMELVDGPSLAQVLAERGPLAVTDAVEVARQVLAGLGAAHARGLLHRDVKPSNALLAPDGTVKLTDFGIATSTADGMTLTQPGAVLGTVAYLAPERVAGRPATAASDLYAVGVVLHEMLTGSPPFTGDTAVAVALAHTAQAPPSLAEQRPEVGAGLDALVRRALAKDPAGRFASAAEMDAALAEVVTGPSLGRSATSRPRAPTPTPTTGQPVDAPHRGDQGSTRALPVAGHPSAGGTPARRGWVRPAALAVVALLAVALAATLVGGALSDRRGDDATAGGLSTTPAPPSPAPVTTTPITPPAEPPPTPTVSDLDALITALEADPDRFGERGEDLLERLLDVREAEDEDVPRLAAETAARVIRWTRRGELDPATAAEAGRVLVDLGRDGSPAGDGDDGDGDDGDGEDGDGDGEDD